LIHRDTRALAIVDVRTGGIVLEASVVASNVGYARACELARDHAPGRRAFAIEGAARSGPVSRVSSPIVMSGCSRSGAFGEPGPWSAPRVFALRA